MIPAKFSPLFPPLIHKNNAQGPQKIFWYVSHICWVFEPQMSACCTFLTTRVRRSADFLKLFVFGKNGIKTRVRLPYLQFPGQPSVTQCPSHSSGFSLSLLSMWRAAVRFSPLQFCFATRLYSSASLVHKWPLSFPLLPPFFHTLPLIWYFFSKYLLFFVCLGLVFVFCSVLLLLSHRLSFNSLCISFYFLFSKPPVDPLSSVSSFIPA